MKKWTIVVVVGRPSADISDFFNSIKFHTHSVEATTKNSALLDFSVPEEALSGGYELLNWYAFPAEEE